MYEIKRLTEEQVEEIENRLTNYDNDFLPKPVDGDIHFGIFDGDHLIGGVDACMTSFRILYVSTVFVDEAYRNKGVGKRLMVHLEEEARKLGAELIRLDTFNWQGRDFYKAIGYEEVGMYAAKGFSEHFFLKVL